MSLLLQAILSLLNARKNRVLLVAQSSLPESQFRAFKKIFLDEFGQSGLEKELVRVFAEDRREER